MNINTPIPHALIPPELLAHPDLAVHFTAIEIPKTALACELQTRAYLLERALSLRARGLMPADLFDTLNLRGWR